MDIVVILFVLAAVIALAVPLGADSRNLSDKSFARDSLWSR